MTHISGLQYFKHTSVSVFVPVYDPYIWLTIFQAY